MKTVPTNLATHLAGEATTLTTIWQITRTDGTIIRLTELDMALTVDGNVYDAAYGYERSALTSSASLDADDIDLEGILNDSFISREDVVAGLYNSADLTISLVNYLAPEDGVMILRRGKLGEITITPTGRFQAQLSSLTSLLKQEVLEKASATCRAQLGDARCSVPVNPDLRANDAGYSVGDFVRVATSGGVGQEVYANRIYECTTAGVSASSVPTFNTSDGAETTDGTVTWITREAWTRNAVVATVTDDRQFTVTITETRAEDDWFNGGVLTFESGNNSGRSYEVKDWAQSPSSVSLFLKADKTVQVGDQLRIVPGCAKTRQHCRFKFDLAGTTYFANGNVVNFRGEPDLPGRDAVLAYPDAQ